MGSSAAPTQQAKIGLIAEAPEPTRMTPDGVVIEARSFEDGTSEALVRGYLAELAQRMPDFDPAAADPPEPADFTPPAGAFLVVTVRGEPAGCGAVSAPRLVLRARQNNHVRVASTPAGATLREGRGLGLA